MEYFTRRDVRAIKLYNFKRGLSPENCVEEMKNVFEDEAPSRSTVFRWYLQFQRGIYKLDDDVRTGRPSTAVSEENIIAVRKLLSDDRRITYEKIQRTLDINAPQVHKILYLHFAWSCKN